LLAHGYTVIEARDGESALRIVEDRRERLHLLLTDVVMPKMGGPELVRRVISRHPDVKVLYMSGYPDDALGEQGVLEPGAVLLQKPFTPQGMADKVRRGPRRNPDLDESLRSLPPGELSAVRPGLILYPRSRRPTLSCRDSHDSILRS
jgi:CheY-like chemotaxis protein